MTAVEHLLRYLKGSISKGFFYPIQQSLQIVDCSYVDQACCLMSRRSLTCIFLGFFLVSWKTKKQSTISKSSTQTKNRSMAATTFELLLLSYIFKICKSQFIILLLCNKLQPIQIIIKEQNILILIVTKLEGIFKKASFSLYSKPIAISRYND